MTIFKIIILYYNIYNIINHFNIGGTTEGMGYTWEQVADVLMVSRTTLWRRLTEIGISELDGVMELLVWDFPRNGIVMMWGQLQSMNIFVTWHSSTTSRRVYNVPSPNYLWHIDVLHCLIRWKIVIHGGSDGFSRRIVYLHASCNNRAETVLHLFRSAVRMCGWPLRVRSNKVGRMWKSLGQ